MTSGLIWRAQGLGNVTEPSWFGRYETGMENAKRKRHGNKPGRRSRLFLLLTDSEATELEQAARESGACSRNLVITEAVRAGLVDSKLKLNQERRRRRIGVWISRRTAVELKQLAHKHNLTQARLLRHFLSQYMAMAPWKATESNGTAAGVRGVEVAS